MTPLYAVPPDATGARAPLVLSPVPFAGDAEVALHHVEGRPGVAVRLYRREGDAALRRARLAAMVARPPEGTAFAWPTALVEDATGRCCGCLLADLGAGPHATLADDLTLGRATPARRLRLGRDLAAAVAELHRLGHAVIDLTPRRVLLRDGADDDSRSSLVLTGLDSVSVQGPQRQCFPGTVRASPWLAPELLQDDTAAVPRTDYQQDRFALAVLLFQLLNHGLHPFQALSRDPARPLTLTDNVRRQRYAYGRQPHPEVAPEPTSVHDSWDETTRALFEQAFTSTDRPPASRWRDHLDALRAAPRSLLEGFILTIGVVSNHGNWFTSGNQNKEMKVLSQSYDWLLFLTDDALAQFITDTLLEPSRDMEPIRDAFLRSYTGKRQKNCFTKVQIDLEADRRLRRYFSSRTSDIDAWFSLITPNNSAISELRAELKLLQQKN